MAHYWIHFTNTFDGSGVQTISDWVSNPIIPSPTTTLTNHIDASGTLTITENPTFHGQVSHDSTFRVSTQTGGTTPNFTYMLSVGIRVTTTTSSPLYTDFASYGLYKYEAGAWTSININHPVNMTAGF